MVIRIIFLLLSLLILVNLGISTACYLTGENLYQKYGKQMLIVFCSFVFLILAFYSAIALIGLK